MSDNKRTNNTFAGYLAESIAAQQSTLDHILNRFNYEVKRFIEGYDVDQDLYEALYDYYISTGEIPYGVAKARTGDPYEWVSKKLADELRNKNSNQSPVDEEVDPLLVPAVQRKGKGNWPLTLDQVRAPRPDSISDKVNLAKAKGNKELDDLARLAGITNESVSVIGGDVVADQQDEMNISTNQSSTGTKNITVTANGDLADALLDILKNAGLSNSNAARCISSQFEKENDDCAVYNVEVEEDYANEPKPQYQSIDKIMATGDDMNREKKQNFPMRAPGNNPMAESVDPLSALSRSLRAEYESMKVVKEDQPGEKIDPTRPWANLPNAKYIDRILTSYRQHLDIWETAFYKWGTLIGHVLLDRAWVKAEAKCEDLGRLDTWEDENIPHIDAVLALISYDECAHYLNMTSEELLPIARRGVAPAVLLLPAVIAFEEIAKPKTQRPQVTATIVSKLQAITNNAGAVSQAEKEELIKLINQL